MSTERVYINMPKGVKAIVPISNLLAIYTTSEDEEVDFIINEWSNDPFQEKISNVAYLKDDSWAFVMDESDEEEEK